ncbi:DMT family transporter [Halobacillus fulvus]|nr:DMT family transporter [Halobacillus fulvus]
MVGALLSIVSGLLISTQNVFNARISEKTGAWLTTTIVLGIGLVCSLPVFYLLDDTSLFYFGDLNKIYLLSGVFGVGIVYCFMRGIALLGPAYSVAIVMVAQLGVAFTINTFGFFGFERMEFSPFKATGLMLLVVGVLIFKLGGRLPALKKERVEKQEMIS